MTNLQMLDISFNNIASMEAVAGVRDCLQRLTSLHASDNPVVTDTDFVVHMVAFCPWLTECNGTHNYDAASVLLINWCHDHNLIRSRRYSNYRSAPRAGVD